MWKKIRSPIERWIVQINLDEDGGRSPISKVNNSRYKSFCWNYYWNSIIISTEGFITGFLNFWNLRSTSIFVEVDLHDPSLDWTPDFFVHLVNHLNFIGKLPRRSQGTPEKSTTPGKKCLHLQPDIVRRSLESENYRPKYQKPSRDSPENTVER